MTLNLMFKEIKLKTFISLTGRFRVDEVTQDQREDCYLATLHINQADAQDSRPYYLVVENERGSDRHSITLKVEGMFPGAFLIFLTFFFIIPKAHFQKLSSLFCCMLLK